MGNLSIHAAREEVEAVARIKGNGNTVLIRSSFLMDESFYPNGHDHARTKPWVVIVLQEKDDKLPDPRTADGKNSGKIAKARDHFKKANKTYYWFDDYAAAESKYHELAGTVCGAVAAAGSLKRAR